MLVYPVRHNENTEHQDYRADNVVWTLQGSLVMKNGTHVVLKEGGTGLVWVVKRQSKRTGSLSLDALATGESIVAMPYEVVECWPCTNAGGDWCCHQSCKDILSSSS